MEINPHWGDYETKLEPMRLTVLLVSALHEDEPSTGQIAGTNDVQANYLIFSVEQDHTELLAIRLALRLNQLLNQRLRLLAVNQFTLLKSNTPVLDQCYSKNRDELAPFQTIVGRSKEVLLYHSL
jgi:hypothetical protein